MAGPMPKAQAGLFSDFSLESYFPQSDNQAQQIDTQS